MRPYGAHRLVSDQVPSHGDVAPITTFGGLKVFTISATPLPRF